MISAYLSKIEMSLMTNRQEWFPMDQELRRRKNLRLGRELGWGLGVFDEWLTWAQTTYGRYIVKNSLDSVGVVIDNREWIASIREGVQRYRDHKPPMPLE